MANLLLSNFTGGEVSPRIYARPGVAKVANGLQLAENCILSTHGGAYKRSGSKFVVRTKFDVAGRHRFIKFQVDVTQSYMLVFGNNYCWFFKDQGVITHPEKTITGVTQANPAVVTAAAHGYANGDRVLITGVVGMEELNNRHFVVANQTTDTFELTGVDSTGYDAYVSGGTSGEIVELTTTYTSAQIKDIQTVQINNVLYIVHPDHPIRKLSRTDDTSWTLETVTPDTGPFRTINGDDSFTITPSAFSGSVTGFGTHVVGETCTLTASSALWDDDHVGAHFRLYEPGGGTGIAGPPLGDADTRLFVGQLYTYQGHVYGISNKTSNLTTWEQVTRVPEHTAGTVRIFTGDSGFNEATGGGGGPEKYLDAAYLHSGYCVVKITAVTSATVATAEIVRYQMPESIVSNGTSFWQEGAWSTYRGYPGAIALYEQRLFLAGSPSDPVVVWGSRTAAYEDFEDGAEDDDAIVYRLAASSGDKIRWLKGYRALMAGTSAGEYIISASTQQEALTPSNIKATQQSDLGSSDVLPLSIDQAVLFPEREGEPQNNAIRLRQFAYSFSQDRFDATDLTVFAEHIFGDGVLRLTYMQSPERIIYCLRTDGKLAAVTYQPDQEAVPWHRHILGGNGVEIKEIAVTAGQDGDELWMQVNRTIDGETASYIEVMSKRFRENRDAKEDGIFLDSSLSYSGAAITEISGLWHLRGETVTMLVDGHVQTGTVTSGGRLTIDDSSAGDTMKVCVGYPYTMVIQTQEFELSSQNLPVAQSRMKRASQMWVRLLQSLGGTIGSDATDQKGLDYRIEYMPMDASPPLKDGYVEFDFDGGYNRELVARLEHNEPFPFHVTGIVAEVSATN